MIAISAAKQQNLNESTLIKKCIDGDRLSQKHFYELYAPKMLSVCIRYVKDHALAEDLLLEGFLKVFKNLARFESKGSLEGWVRRIMVNQCLMHLRKNKVHFQEIEQVFDLSDSIPSAQQEMEANEILALVSKLPTGYKTIFNLYVIEGYKHKEIAELLGISINTSKSQLIQARKKIQEMLKSKHHPVNKISDGE